MLALSSDIVASPSPAAVCRPPRTKVILALVTCVVMGLVGCDKMPEQVASSDAATDVDATDGMSVEDTWVAEVTDAADGADATKLPDIDLPPALSWPLRLEAGQVADVPVVDGIAGLALKNEAGNERWLVVLGSTDLQSAATEYAYSIQRAAMPFGLGDPQLADTCTIASEPWADATPPDEAPPSGTGPTTGELRSFVVPVGILGVEVAFEATSVGEQAVVWEDVSVDHPANLDPVFVREFLGDFEAVILPRIRTMSGIESDFDGDGRIHLLFTPLTYQSAVAFFMSCDLGAADCPPTNSGEILYLTPPNTIPPPYNTANAIKEILAHELGHLVGYNRSVLRNGLDAWADNAYVLEGFGALAQDVSGYQSGNFYVTKAGLDEIDDVGMGEVLTDEGRYVSGRDGALRGAAYLFVRWLYDRGGGDEALSTGELVDVGGPAFVRALQDDPLSVAHALAGKTGAGLEDIVMDFFTTLGVSNRDAVGGVAPENPCYTYLPTVTDPVTDRQRGADVFTFFHGQAMNGPATQRWEDADGVLRAGGVEYLVIDATTAGMMEMVLSVDLGAQARVRVARLR